MLLAETDVESLTGYRRPSAQIRWLRDNGWRFTVNALGKPIIALAEFNRRMVGGVHRTIAQQEPDWDAINALPQGS
jgi:Domain of unknown function (DUF4224)